MGQGWIGWGISLVMVALSWLWVATGGAVATVWPTLTALVIVFVTRRALTGLLLGAVCGAIILSDGNLWSAYLALWGKHFAPNLGSSWKTGGIAFTLLLGGFAAIIERGGGLAFLVTRLLRRTADAARSLKTGVFSLGVVCFFDGLANSMLVGRVSRKLADQHGVSRAKLAYITDSTSSAVACVAFISTWIAFQLSLISSGFDQVGYDASPYAYFFQSLPANYYCWFTLILLWLAIRYRFHPGPMAKFEAEAQAAYAEAQAAQAVAKAELAEEPLSQADTHTKHAHASVAVPTAETAPEPDALETMASPWRALVPLGVLMGALLIGFYGFGLQEIDRPALPITKEKVADAFGSNAGPLAMTVASVLAVIVALAMFPGRKSVGLQAFGEGAKAMIQPLLILVGAWVLGSTLDDLGTGALVGRLVGDVAPLWLLPVLVFIAGAATSFGTGSSWGTMAIIMPLAIPAIAGHPDFTEGLESYYALAIAATFSGAVFGDHCSPISDTTIVSSIACDIAPYDHVRTQLPYALIAASLAVLLGFLPAGLGLPPWLSLLLGVGTLFAIVRFSGQGREAV